MSTKYVITTTSGEIVFGADGLLSIKEAKEIAKSMAYCDYGKMKIHKLVLIEEVTKPKVKITKKK